MTSTTEPKETAIMTGDATGTAATGTGDNAKMSRGSTLWDQAKKGFLTDAERIAKNMDVEGKGHLSRDQAVALGAQYQSLKEDTKRIKNQLYGLAILCVLLFIGTVAGTVMAVKNSKDTIVDMKTGVMKINDGGAGEVDIVTVKAQGTIFKTIASIEVEEDIFDSETNETSTETYTSYCVSGEDVASMWLANEEGSDARLVMVNDDSIINEDDDDDDDDDDTEISRIQPVTNGPATWKKDRIVMGGMIFTANEECSNAVHRKRRMLLQEYNNDIEQNENENKKDDMQSFDPILIHRALKRRVDFLTTGRGHGRDLSHRDDTQCTWLNPSCRLGSYVVKSGCSKTAAPTIKIDGNECQDYTVKASTYLGSPVAVKWESTIQDDCNTRAFFFRTSKSSGDTFDVGTTPVTVMYKYISNGGYILSTCTFNVIVSEIDVPVGIDITTTIDGEDF